MGQVGRLSYISGADRGEGCRQKRIPVSRGESRAPDTPVLLPLAEQQCCSADGNMLAQSCILQVSDCQPLTENVCHPAKLRSLWRTRSVFGIWKFGGCQHCLADPEPFSTLHYSKDTAPSPEGDSFWIFHSPKGCVREKSADGCCSIGHRACM